MTIGVKQMAPRFVFAAFIFAFVVAAVFATLTTLHQVRAHTMATASSAAHG
jgi:hypothetical protein